MFRSALVVMLALTALTARAQQAPVDAPPPSVVPTPGPPPIIAAEEDRSVVMTDDDELLYGAARQKLTPVELFRTLGRTDLVAQSEANLQRRSVLGVTGGVVAVVGIAVGVALLATTPDLTTGPCGTDIALYNDKCRAEASLHQVSGGISIAAGVLIGGILGSIAYWNRPEVLTKFELRKFVDEHNASIGAPKSTFKLELTPAVGPAFSGLVARGTF